MRKIAVFLPGVLPGEYLSPNRGERKEGRASFAIAAAKGNLRARVHKELVERPEVQAIGEPFSRAHIVLFLRWHKRKQGSGFYRPDDPGNACYALKAAIDGIKDAGLIEDDSYKYVALLTTSVERVDSFEEEGLGITVIEMDGA